MANAIAQPIRDNPALKSVRNLILTMVIAVIFVFVVLYFIDNSIKSATPTITEAGLSPLLNTLSTAGALILGGLIFVIFFLIVIYLILRRKARPAVTGPVASM